MIRIRNTGVVKSHYPRLTPQIHGMVAQYAKRSGISVNAFIRRAVEKQLEALMM